MFDSNIVPEEFADVARVQAAEQDALLARPGVVGVALGNKYTDGVDTGQTAVTVLVETKLADSMLSDAERVPPTLDDTVTDVQEVGVLQALQLEPSAGGALAMGMLAPYGNGTVAVNGMASALAPNDVALAAREQVGPFTLAKRVRPAFGGVSVGHVKITAGTLGTCCYDAAAFPGKPPRYYILSNNHVLANSNAASIGDPILQPGPFDGGAFPADVIARLSRFVPIKFIQAGQPAPLNFVDAAIAEGQFHDLDRRIYWVGNLKGINSTPVVGLVVQKCGRTTNYTTGRITNINATVDVNYGSGQVARFVQQIITGDMSAGGDSGSLVADLNEQAVGLLFAGSATATIINPIARVQQLLGIRVTE